MEEKVNLDPEAPDSAPPTAVPEGIEQQEQARPMTTAERLQDALDKGGKVRGLKAPRYDKNNVLTGYAIQWVSVMGSDIAELAATVENPDVVVSDLAKANKPLAGTDQLVTIKADHLFHLLEKAGGGAKRKRHDKEKEQPAG